MLAYARPSAVRNAIDAIMRRRYWILGVVILFVLVLPCAKLFCYLAVPHAREVVNGEGRRVSFTSNWFHSEETVEGVLTRSEFELNEKWGFFSLRVEVQWQTPDSSGHVGSVLNPEDTWRIKFLD